ncbi:MAG: hypothetical protein LR015_15775 [Verrucomicrobia bacterium]|nr:hypothetical protein [Verrucomicrobiota bacterium]
MGAGVSDLGGLYVLGTERHTSRRIDRQLRGRCARQGDPGTTRFFLSLEDELMRLYSQGSAGKLLESSFEEGQPLEHRWLNPMIERAQKTVEQHHYSVRRRLLQYDDVGSKQREVIYGLRNDALLSDEPKEIIFELIREEVQHRIEEFAVSDPKAASEKDYQDYLNWVCQTFPVSLKEQELTGKSGADIEKLTLSRIEEAYQVKEAAEDPQMLRQLERMVVISNVDRNWQTHLTEMEDLRQSVGLRGYGQKDPLVEYKSEAFGFFEQMMNQVRTDICSGIFRSVTNMRAYQNMIAHLQRTARTTGPAGPDGAAAGAVAAQPAVAGADSGAHTSAAAGKPLPSVKRTPVRIANEPARNDVVTIRKGVETQKLKWKKAEKMVKEEGWLLVEEK